MRTSAPFGDNVENHRLLGGFQSPDEPFFNFKTSAMADTTDQMLYAPRMKLSVGTA